MKYTADPSIIVFYHAHIYYGDQTRPTAERLRTEIEARFDVVMGRWRDEPVGPHPQAMYQVKFNPPEFAKIVPWLMINRAGLNVLVHPETGDAVRDHLVHALWLGEKLPLRIDILRKFAESHAQSTT
jgi:DOPA 4,5-dioxygenase